MGLIDLFDKWIVERGSAVVQEKQISLFRDQLSIADKRISDLESENVVLKRKLDNSESKSKQLTQENSELKKKIQTYEKPIHDVSLPEEQVKILLCLAANGEDVAFDFILATCNLSKQVGFYHLHELEDNDMVSADYITETIADWSIAHEGRRYLIDHKLIS